VASRILLPLVSPVVALAALVVFALAFSEVGVPMFLRVRTYPAAVLVRLGGVAYAPREAFVLVLPLLGLAAGLALLERRFAGLRTLSAMGLRRDRPRWSLGPWRWPVTIVSWTVVMLGLAPLAALGSQAVRGHEMRAAMTAAASSAWNSLVAAAVAATLAVGVGLVLGRSLAARRPAARVVDAIAVLAFITPAAALGTGVIAVWNRPSTSAVYGGAMIVVIGLVARYAVLGIRPLAAAIAHTPPHLDDAARVTGASYLRRLGGIVIPLHRRALLGTWLLVAIFALRDLETVVMFYPAGEEPLTVRIFTLEANGAPAMVATLASLHVVLTALVVVAGAVSIGRRR